MRLASAIREARWEDADDELTACVVYFRGFVVLLEECSANAAEHPAPNFDPEMGFVGALSHAVEHMGLVSDAVSRARNRLGFPNRSRNPSTWPVRPSPSNAERVAAAQASLDGLERAIANGTCSAGFALARAFQCGADFQSKEVFGQHGQELRESTALLNARDALANAVGWIESLSPSASRHGRIIMYREALAGIVAEIERRKGGEEKEDAPIRVVRELFDFGGEIGDLLKSAFHLIAAGKLLEASEAIVTAAEKIRANVDQASALYEGDHSVEAENERGALIVAQAIGKALAFFGAALATEVSR